MAMAVTCRRLAGFAVLATALLTLCVLLSGKGYIQNAAAVRRMVGMDNVLGANPESAFSRQVIYGPPSWSYDDTLGNGPANWKDLPQSACDGSSQSPINIGTTALGPQGTDTLMFAYDTIPAGTQLMNSGNTVDVAENLGNSILTVGTAKYRLVDFHFHFPSEHTVDGQVYAAEMHLVHDRCADTACSSLLTTDLVVVGVFLEVGTGPTPSTTFLTNIGFVNQSGSTDTFPQEPCPTVGFPTSNPEVNCPEDSTFNFTNAVNIQTSFEGSVGGNFYHYRGSLTTPLCNEIVGWYVLQTPSVVTAEQQAIFRATFASPADARPVQPLNGRVVVLNSFADITEEPSSCFPGEADVFVEQRGKVSARTLRRGDRVLVSRESESMAYEPVTGFLHEVHAEGPWHSYLVVEHIAGTFRATADHLVFSTATDGGWRSLATSELRPGDSVILADESKVSRVLAVHQVIRADASLIAPMTSSGTIVVDGVVASTYAVTSGMHVPHNAMHAAFFPIHAASYPHH
eukprot:TRINITY_DN20569_c0_g1_i3.p1 TRINITY_DN20569_c0_g1~~TRINITY_DN20569_c0_g1_i3.p1  ORF type:complete len:539 (+),score=45.64 TRINITY_DN20569_c0_g1_i3:74-1618(+)